VFFFAMIFAISMDYTVFLLSSAKEHHDRSRDPREASIGGLAHSGRVIFAAGAVMVAVFFTFALSGPLPPKEMGVILGIAVLLDAMLGAVCSQRSSTPRRGLGRFRSSPRICWNAHFVVRAPENRMDKPELGFSEGRARAAMPLRRCRCRQQGWQPARAPNVPPKPV
jgi:predicted RND superfamily exporter protein